MQQRETHLRRGYKEATGLAPVVQTALQKLASAYGYARDVECDPWQFAVEIQRLTAIGLTVSDLRWLATKGYIVHASEITRPNDASRRFRAGRNLAFTEKTCFVITDTGLLLANDKPANGNLHHLPKANVAGTEDGVPSWDSEARVLCVGGRIVKRYRVPSPNQEAVLSSFQEEGWPKFIHDPLSPIAEYPPKERLRETIRGLNTNQKNVLIRFRGDGTGERVCWELVDNGVSHGAATRNGLRPVV